MWLMSFAEITHAYYGCMFNSASSFPAWAKRKLNHGVANLACVMTSWSCRSKEQWEEERAHAVEWCGRYSRESAGVWSKTENGRDRAQCPQLVGIKLGTTKEKMFRLSPDLSSIMKRQGTSSNG